MTKPIDRIMAEFEKLLNQNDIESDAIDDDNSGHKELIEDCRKFVKEIAKALTKIQEEAREEGKTEAFNKVLDIMAEFDSIPKEALSIIGEHIGLYLHAKSLNKDNK